jgi:hypothetical protein
MERLERIIGKVEAKCTEENLPWCHFVRSRSYINYPKTEPGTPTVNAGE